MFRAIEAREDETKARQQAFDALKIMTSDVVERKFVQGSVLTEDDRAFLRGVIAQFEAFAAIKGDDIDSRGCRPRDDSVSARCVAVWVNCPRPEKDYDEAEHPQATGDRFPDPPEFRQDLADSHNNRGILLRAMGRLTRQRRITTRLSASRSRWRTTSRFARVSPGSGQKPPRPRHSAE